MAYNNSNKSKKFYGCHSTMIKQGKNKGEVAIFGWHKNREMGFISMSAFPKRKGKKKRSKNGNTWIPYLVVIKTKGGLDKKLMNGLYSPDLNKLFVDELQFVAKPNTDYFGSYK